MAGGRRQSFGEALLDLRPATLHPHGARRGTRSSSITSIMQKSASSGTRMAQIASKVCSSDPPASETDGYFAENPEAPSRLSFARDEDREHDDESRKGHQRYLDPGHPPPSGRSPRY
jgi:hypothetical protein